MNDINELREMWKAAAGVLLPKKGAGTGEYALFCLYVVSLPLASLGLLIFLGLQAALALPGWLLAKALRRFLA